MKDIYKYSLTIFVMFIMFVITFYVITSEEKITTLYSQTGCCSITINHSFDTDVYTVSYIDITTSEEDAIICNKQELDATINVYQEYCYQHHDKYRRIK